MYVARDKDSRLYLFSEKPSKRGYFWMMNNIKREVIQLPNDLFPEVKWEDEEPRELILKPIKDE